MPLQNLLLHLSFLIGLTLLSMVLTRLMLKRARIMDVPNARSSHRSPTPKSGGVAIVATFVVGIAIIYLVADKAVIRQHYFAGFVFSALLIAAVSFYDDLKARSFRVKLCTQLLAIVVVLGFGLLIDGLALPLVGPISLGAWSFPITFLWILGLTNAFNFMDGLDGLAAGCAVIVAGFFAYITLSQGSAFVYITSYALIAGAAGFLTYNQQPARIFMGDVGSAFLGFVFAVLAIIAARHDASHTSFMVMPLLLFNFIYDTLFTFLRRLVRGERVTDPHRTHLYQLLNQMGLSHRSVSWLHYGMCGLQGLGAIWMVHIPGSDRAMVFLPFLALQLAYSFVVIRQAKTRGLL